MPQIENLVDKLESRLPEDGRRLLSAVRAEAESQGLRAFLVGGTVRDLLLNRDSLDVDLVIEGDAVALARRVARTTGAQLAKTTVFGTATLRDDSFSLDLATARAESYSKPGALPKVRPSSIDDDLLRRDFTINAIAAQMTPPATGEILDPVGGTQDLQIGLIRVLHDDSFRDDATRILRAVRYETRFGFRLEDRTLDLLHRDLSNLDTISGTRIRQELVRTFAEAEPERALLRLQKLGVLSGIHPSLAFGEKQAEAVRWLRDYRVSSLALWPVLAWDAADIMDLTRRLMFTRPQAQAVVALAQAKDAASRLSPGNRNSKVAALLNPLPLATTLALAAMTNDGRIVQYATSLRTVRSIMRGDDVIASGVPRGPDVALVLDLLRAAKLDGEVSTRADEERLVEMFLARELIGLV